MEAHKRIGGFAHHDGMILFCIVGVVAAAAGPFAWRLREGPHSVAGTAILAGLALLLVYAFGVMVLEEFQLGGIEAVVATVVVLAIIGGLVFGGAKLLRCDSASDPKVTEIEEPSDRGGELRGTPDGAPAASQPRGMD